MPARKIDDAEPTHAETKAIFGPGTLIIRTSMDEGLRHLVNDLKAVGFVEGADHAGDSAHDAIIYRIKAVAGFVSLGKARVFNSLGNYTGYVARAETLDSIRDPPIT